MGVMLIMIKGLMSLGWSYSQLSSFLLSYDLPLLILKFFFLFLQGNSQICECPCPFGAHRQQERRFGVTGVHPYFPNKRKMALAGLSGMLFIILIQHIGILLEHTSACNNVYREIPRVFLFARKKWPLLQRCFAVSVQLHSNSFLRLSQL